MVPLSCCSAVAHSSGHFAPDKYNLRTETHGGRKHELSLNPDDFTGKTDKQVGQTMLHEMVHEWQHHHGKKKRAKYSYHDREWADKMQSLGLMPSNTGMVGGKRTGTQMSDYIIPGGAYDRAFDELAATGWRLNLESAIVPGRIKKPDESKTKFTCSGCGWIIRGKPDTEVVCRGCLLDGLADLSWLNAGKTKQLVELIGRKVMLPDRPAQPDPVVIASYDRVAAEATE